MSKTQIKEKIDELEKIVEFEKLTKIEKLENTFQVQLGSDRIVTCQKPKETTKPKFKTTGWLDLTKSTAGLNFDVKETLTTEEENELRAIISSHLRIKLST